MRIQYLLGNHHSSLNLLHGNSNIAVSVKKKTELILVGGKNWLPLKNWAIFTD